MTDILVVAPAPPLVADQLEGLGTVHNLHAASDKDEMIAEIGDRVTVAVAMGGFDGALHERLPNLALISSYGVGYDGIDVPLAASHGVAVTNTPNVLNDAVAELIRYRRDRPESWFARRAGYIDACSVPLPVRRP